MNRNSFTMLLIPTLLITVFSVNEFNGAEQTTTNADPENQILSVLLSPQHKSELALSSHVVQQLTALQSRRIVLFNELHSKDSRTQREIANQEFQLQTSQLALSLLNVSQRGTVNQIQLRRIGLRSLLRPEIRATLSLNESQLQRIQNLSQQRIQLSRGANAIEQSQLFVMVERRIYATLNDNQRQIWLRLIGTDQVPVALVQDESPQETALEESAPADTPPAVETPAKPASTPPTAEGTEPIQNTTTEPTPTKDDPQPVVES
ncbi:MAG: hypothetical protein HOF15_10095, partial [Planctomycetaceae bacterium]|nr:hypothetical protein [Planctomycetaceae bacterium]